MKRAFTVVSAALVLGLGTIGAANAAPRTVQLADTINHSQLLSEILAVQNRGLESWHVGDRMDYNISMGGFAQVGTMTKSMTKDEGTALWLHEEISLQGQKQTVDTEIDKATGKVLKMIQNGQEQQVPDPHLQIISEDSAQVTVPAGTFNSIHIVAKSDQAKKIEVWMNPHDTVLDGTLKQDVSTNFGVDLVMELTHFSHG